MPPNLLDVLSWGAGYGRVDVVTMSEWDANSVGAGASMDWWWTPTKMTPTIRMYTGGSSVTSYGERVLAADQGTLCLQFKVYFENVPTALTGLAMIVDSSGNPLAEIRVTAAGLWAVYCYANTTQYTSTGPALVRQRYYCLELKLVVHATAGSLDLKVEQVLESGVSAISGIDTRGSNGLARKYRLGVTTAQANAGWRGFIDVMVADDWLNNAYMLALRPREATLANWTLNGGQTIAVALGENQWGSGISGSNLSSSTSGQEERLAMNRIQGNDSRIAILGLQPVVQMASSPTGSKITVALRSNGVNGTAVDLTYSSGSGSLYGRGALQVVDPNTSAAWTFAAVNAVELSLTKEASTVLTYIDAVFVYIALQVQSFVGCHVSGFLGTLQSQERHALPATHLAHLGGQVKPQRHRPGHYQRRRLP